ncbi:MAG: hypothetical protein ABEJ70_05400 [Halobacteriaceae archaeon]
MGPLQAAAANAALLVSLVVTLGVGGALLVWALVEHEHDRRDRTDRGDAERRARRDTRDDGPER